MGCQQGLWTHRWRARVTSAQTITAIESDMWARPVYRDYVHCEKHEECDACGATRRHRSCMCEVAQADQCAIYLDWRAETERPRE